MNSKAYCTDCNVNDNCNKIFKLIKILKNVFATFFRIFQLQNAIKKTTIIVVLDVVQELCSESAFAN